jgi:predicted nucleic acid-binding protein
MKVFVDTNVFLDLILKRERHQEALAIFHAVETGIFEAYILDITLLNIDYIARKQVKDLTAFLSLVTEYFHIVGGSNESMQKALELNHGDLEDSLQYISAVQSHCDIIITNDKGFPKGRIPTMTSEYICQKHL